ncbi:MAG TPA: PDZ domain-containing protein [Desulfuromonadaceae bacterium]
MTEQDHTHTTHDNQPTTLDILGMTVANIDHLSAVHSGMGLRSGVIVRMVRRGSAAHREGVEAGDIVFEVNGRLTTTLKDLADSVADHEPRVPIRILFRGTGIWRLVSLPLGTIEAGMAENR